MIYQCVIYHFIPPSSKSTLGGSACNAGTFFSCQLARWLASSVENPGGILEEKQLLVSVHPLSWQVPIMLCGQGIWYLSMVPPSEAQKVISQFPNAAPLWTSLPSSGLQKCTFQGGPGPSLTEQRTLSTLLVSWVICVTSSRILFSSYLLL